MTHRILILALPLIALVGCSSSDDAATTAADARVNDDAAAPAEESGPDTATGTDTAIADASDAPTFKQVLAEVITEGTCGNGYCHGNGAGGWTYGSESAVYAALVGPDSTKCAGMKRVEPGDPERSALYLKLRGGFGAQCTGNRMPPSGTLADAKLELVRAWIAAGAKP